MFFPHALRRPRIVGALALGVLAAPAAAQAYPAAKEIATYDSAGAISAARGYVAVTVGDGNARALYVGHPGAIAPAKGVGSLPAWARPHVGIDEAQKTVVIYPRCDSDETTCDLYSYAVLTGQERKLDAVDTAGNEIEGTIDHGTIAFTRGVAAGGSGAAGEAESVGRRLYVLRRSAKVPTLISGAGGDQLALHGTSLAQVRDTDPASAVCGHPTLELFNTATRARTVVDSTSCGMDAATVGSPAFVGTSIVWTWTSLGKGGFLFARNLTSGARSKAPLQQSAQSFAATGLGGGYLLQVPAEAEPTAHLYKVRGVKYRAAPKGH